MHRRATVLALLAFGAAPLAGRAQKPGRTVRVGFLGGADCFTSACPSSFAWLALERNLRDFGYREGENLAIERRHGPDAPSRKAAAGELVKRNVDVIVVFGAPLLTAAAQSSRTTPIVSYAGDQVALGFAASFARPGGNVTGVSPATPPMTLKELEFLRMLVPRARRVVWLRNPKNPYFTAAFGEEIRKAAAALGIAATSFDAESADSLDAAVKDIAQQGFDAVLVPADTTFVLHRARLAAALLRHRLPSVSLDRVMLDAGLLMTYGPDVLDGVRRMASQIDKILRGARPGELPIEFIDRLQLGINAQTAQALGIAIPQSIRLRADRVIE